MCYEGNVAHNWGNISAFELVNRFWCVMTMGGYGTHGETFLSEDNILWWAAGGYLKGDSPRRIAWLKDIFTGFPGPLIPRKPEMSLPTTLFDDQALFEQTLATMPEAYREKLAAVGRSLLGISEYERDFYLMKDISFMGHYGEMMYLNYYARTCPVKASLSLPAETSYRIEVLDVWEMTRTIVKNKACGDVTIQLPGKEGIALLAIAT